MEIASGALMQDRITPNKPNIAEPVIIVPKASFHECPIQQLTPSQRPFHQKMSAAPKATENAAEIEFLISGLQDLLKAKFLIKVWTVWRRSETESPNDMANMLGVEQSGAYFEVDT